MSYQEKCFIFLNSFDIYTKPTLKATSILSPCHSPSNQLCVYVSKESYIFQNFFLNTFGMLLKWRLYFSSPFHLHSPPPPPLAPEPTKQVTRTGIY